jgi:exodeoxyribonuclease VII small subunit
MTNNQLPSFEDALSELENIVARLEAGGLTLEESLRLFERGQDLAAVCERALSAVELRLEELRRTTGGSFEAVSFDNTQE